MSEGGGPAEDPRRAPVLGGEPPARTAPTARGTGRQELRRGRGHANPPPAERRSARPPRGGRWRVRGRPIGLWLLIGVTVGQALGFFVASREALDLAAENWPAALGSAVFGALLLKRAVALWRCGRTVWLAVVVFTTLGALVQAVQIARGHGGPGAWASLGWA